MANVLVIEDNDMAYLVIKRQIESLGHTASRLDGFARLPALVATKPPDVIVLDLNLPVLSGVELGKMVRRSEKQKIPIIIHSAQETKELFTAMREVGAVAMLRKGASMDQVRSAFERAFATGYSTQASPSP